MGRQTLAVKYRPHDWSDVIEQDNIKTILTKQLENKEIKNAYENINLYCVW